MKKSESKPPDPDAQLPAESRRLLAEMEDLIGRARVLLLEKSNVRSSRTLGDVLYADRAQPRVAEKDWVALVHGMAAGDPVALHALYERAHEVVFMLLSRLVRDRKTAQRLTLDVFQDAWREAARFERRNSTVLGWLMNLAQARAAMKQTSEAVVAIDRNYRSGWQEPQWQQVAPGISVKMLADDDEQHRVSMLVRLVPGGEYPPHTHAGAEELHLLEGELWIDERKLHPGAYNRAEPGTGDQRVWSETGCMCLLVTSTKDVLR